MKKILIIEDDYELQALLKIAFETAGYEVHSAVDGRRGLELVFELRPDIVLLDLMLPMLPGIEVLKQIPLDRIPAIVMTAYGDPEGLLERCALVRGASEFVNKPVRSSALVSLVGRTLEKFACRVPTST